MSSNTYAFQSDAPDFRGLRQFYIDHLKHVLLKFWMERGIDREYGGYYTCFDNTGEKLVSTDKFTWSQGRFAWMLAELATMDIFTAEERAEFLALSEKGAKFLMKHVLHPEGGCAFVLDRYGNAKRLAPDMPYVLGKNADMFALIGVAGYARESGDREALEFAMKLFKIIRDDNPNLKVPSYPYPPIPGYKGPPMMMINVAHELARTLRAFGDPRADVAHRVAEESMETVMRDFITEDYVSHEKIGLDNRFVTDTMVGRYVNPGHTIEDMWFIIHQAQVTGNTAIIEKALKVIKKTFDIGWDAEYGGMLLFVDQDGGQPKGDIHETDKGAMLDKIVNDWSNKLWWVHSETLYATLLAYGISKDAEFLKLYEKTHAYAFKTFPHPNADVGEWIQIRNRMGEPENKVVALPVKDPFHIVRNVIYIIRTLDALEG